MPPTQPTAATKAPLSYIQSALDGVETDKKLNAAVPGLA